MTSLRIEDHLPHLRLGQVLTHVNGGRYIYVGRVHGAQGFSYYFQPEVITGRIWSPSTWSLMPTLLKHFPELPKEVT